MLCVNLFVVVLDKFSIHEYVPIIIGTLMGKVHGLQRVHVTCKTSVCSLKFELCLAGSHHVQHGATALVEVRE